MKTLKEFENYLNKTYKDSQWKNGIRGQRTRDYGTYLRSQDREYFNIYFEEYLEDNNLPAYKERIPAESRLNPKGKWA